MRSRLIGTELEEYLQRITAGLVAVFDPSRIILFGSFARGDQNRASDLDIVVIAPTRLPFCERIGKALACCYAASTRLPIEVLVYTPEEWRRMLQENNPLLSLVAREGRILYGGKPKRDRGTPLAETGAA